MIRTALLICLSWLALSGLAAVPAAAQLFRMDPGPDGMVAYWSFDPSIPPNAGQGDPHRQLLEQALIALVHRAMSTDQSPMMTLPALLDPTLLRDSPYRLMLLDLQVDSGPEPAPGVPVKLSRLQAALEIFTSPERRDEFERAIERQRQALGLPKPEQLPLRARAVGQVINPGDSVQEFSWLWTNNSLIVGWGSGSIAELFENRPGRRTRESPWRNHREEARSRRGDHLPVLEAFVDLDRLRQLVPDEVGWGTLGEMLHASGVSNGRSCMLHGWLPPKVDAEAHQANPQPRLLQLDISWSSRAEARGAIRGRTLTHDAWHAGLGPPPAQAPYAMVLAPAWHDWLASALLTWQALTPEDREFAARRERWQQRYAGPLKRLESDLAPVAALVAGHETEPPKLIVPARPFGRGDVQQNLQTVLASVSPPVRHEVRERCWMIPMPIAQGREHWTLRLRVTPEAVIGEWHPAPRSSGGAPPGSAGDRP